MSIESLPRELISMILNASDFSSSELFALCRFPVFHHDATSLLYQSFHAKPKMLPFLLRTILFNPQYTRFIERAHFERLRVIVDMTEDDFDLFASYVQGLSLSHEIRACWMHQLRKGNSEALGSILLTRLSNIREIKICGEDELESRNGMPSPCFSGQISYWSLPLLELDQPLRNIKRISIDSSPVSTDTLLRLFLLPSLKSVHVWNLFESKEQRNTDRFPQPISHVSELKIKGGSIPFTSLERILASCKILRSFAYDSPKDSQVTSCYSSLGLVLYRFLGSMEALSFVDQNAWANSISPIGSLQSFKKLQVFSCDAEVLYSLGDFKPLSSLLPTNLVRLNMHETLKEVLDNLGGPNGVLEDMTHNAAFNHLRYIYITTSMGGTFTDKDFQNLHFQSRGTDLRLLGRLCYEKDHDD
ncbi:hypothetical protein BS50DRAFT_593432 [Corynespora cassiicola Philippines]|uniref:F-box domain-containing protein n=1 Tax=Corynespora cassiicola Philippines TaxID=1448308 RepID=A0A2T2N6P8_CORCC|nr:hypothetical protein BS50DRAFT_593432 [Corynespora cassiicola Philippines]